MLQARDTAEWGGQRHNELSALAWPMYSYGVGQIFQVQSSNYFNFDLSKRAH